ncbi:unnamed protein product [Hyaloperonospora brassicae]|uniref:Prephenate dehydratase n=1 Tax=Hyaloperonospora brassicae TaxID=162125 RepID=A0AAV0TR46_HYABA|nr:unnamed protein product [Hyaloperonospora brassicae]
MGSIAPALPPAKSDKKRSFTVTEKLAVVAACKAQSLRSAARQFNVDRNCVRAWRDKEAELLALHPTAKRLPGAGRRRQRRSLLSNVARRTDGQHNGETIVSANENRAAPSRKMIPTHDLITMTTTMATTSTSPTTKTTALTDSNKYVLVGFQGKEGAFSEVAAKTAFEELRLTHPHALMHDEFMTVGFPHTSDVMDAVERSVMTFGVLPVENSLSGTFHGILDRLVASHLKIVGEVIAVQELCLCALPGVRLHEIETLSSHPAVLDHCERFICAMERSSGKIVARHAAWDSAGACQEVQQEQKRHVAAIASEQAALAHGLVVLERSVGDELNNETRYMIVGRLDASSLPLGTTAATTTKSSIVIAVPNEPQALFKIVSAFALRNVMIVKIESRPASTAGRLFAAQTTHWDYIFYIDYMTSQDVTQEARLRANLEEFALWVKDLGTYTSSSGKTSVEPPRWTSVMNVVAC